MTTSPAPNWADLSPASKQLACGILSTAVEGGINYWALVRSYMWVARDETGEPIDDEYGGLLFSEDTHAILRVTGGDYWDEDENEDEELMRLDGPVILRGLIALSNGSIHGCKTSYGGSWSDVLFKVLAGDENTDLDAGDADCVAQAGLFGEIVYG